jgi:hypothetical protein
MGLYYEEATMRQHLETEPQYYCRDCGGVTQLYFMGEEDSSALCAWCIQVVLDDMTVD